MCLRTREYYVKRVNDHLHGTAVRRILCARRAARGPFGSNTPMVAWIGAVASACEPFSGAGGIGRIGGSTGRAGVRQGAARRGERAVTGAGERCQRTHAACTCPGRALKKRTGNLKSLSPLRASWWASQSREATTAASRALGVR